MRNVRWNQSLQTGDAEVDEQHRALIELVGAVRAGAASGPDPDREAAALDGIVDYASRHFAAEETLMTRFAYPGLAEHRSVHDEFAQTAQRLVSAHRTGSGLSLAELAEFLQEWLERHITHFDQPMIAFVRAKRARSGG